MTIRKPDYFDSFHCIGGACTDTCCAGWEIEVDEESCSRYLQMKGKTGNRLRKELTVTEEESYFALKDGKCPFLNKNGLCDLILAEGEDILCDICREHPRFYNWYGSQTEVGLGLCCEEAERLLFSNSKPASFIVEVQENTEDDNLQEEEEIFVRQMMEARETAFAIVQNRNLPLGMRLQCVQLFGQQLQTLMDNEELDGLDNLCEIYRDHIEAPMDYLKKQQYTEKAADAVCELLSEYALWEALDANWPKLLVKTGKKAETLLSQSSAFVEQYPESSWEYEHLFVYFLNRYFMESVFDMDVLSKIRFGLAGLIVVRMLELESRERTGQRTEKNRDDIIRRYSKEIEYCPENVAALVDASWTLSALQDAKLNVMIQEVFASE